MKNISFVILMLIFAGCSTTNRNVSNFSNLQVKVARLENNIEKRDQEMANLKMEVRGLKQMVEGLDTLGEDLNEDFEHMKIEEPVLKKKTISSKSKKKESLIRVPVGIKDVQEALSKAGYYQGTIDGKIGNKTKSAIFGFQKDHGLKMDGIIGKKTWTEMQIYLDK